MIRYAFIYNQVLQIYCSMDQITFPIEPCSIIDRYPNCKYITYQDFAEMNQCDIREVILLCESKSGCTHYDAAKNRYLILWNEDRADNNVTGRRRWTKAHELGHVVLRHFPLVTEPALAENSFSNLTAPTLEAEADHFAATLLAPMPLFSVLGIASVWDIRQTFGLSKEAATNRWNEYLTWKRSHRKTAWENDLRRVYKYKGCNNFNLCKP